MDKISEDSQTSLTMVANIPTRGFNSKLELKYYKQEYKKSWYATTNVTITHMEGAFRTRACTVGLILVDICVLISPFTGSQTAEYT